MKLLHVLHMPRKIKLMCSKCCACNAKAGDAQGTQGDARLLLTYEVAPCAAPATQNEASASSAAPATQNEADVLHVLHLPGKSKF